MPEKTPDPPQTVFSPREAAEPPKPTTRPSRAAATEPPETPYEAIMRRIAASPDGHITTTKAAFQRVLDSPSTPPDQVIELQHMADHLVIYIEDR